MRNNTCDKAVGEIRWQVIKAMLTEFPTLKEKAARVTKPDLQGPLIIL